MNVIPELVVMSFGSWRNNAELIRDAVVPLGYLKREWIVLDPTYGKGNFWSLWKPDELHASDLYPRGIGSDPHQKIVKMDFRYLLWTDNTFDATVFDPPYKLNGTGGSHPSDEAYGVADPYMSIEYRHEMIRLGLDECVRVTRVGGHILLKCQNQVSSGKIRWQVLEFAQEAEFMGAELIDMFHLPSYRPQPSGRKQKHSRQNYSTLLVFRKD